MIQNENKANIVRNLHARYWYDIAKQYQKQSIYLLAVNLKIAVDIEN